MCDEDRFVKYDGTKIVDLKLVESWIISSGDVDALLSLLNNKDCTKKRLIEEFYNPKLEGYKVLKKNGISPPIVKGGDS